MRSIRFRLVLIFGACMILILGVVVAFTAIKLRNQAIDSAHSNIQQTVRNTAWRCKAVLDQGVISAKILASAISGISGSSLQETIGAVDATLEHAMSENRSIVATFVSGRHHYGPGNDKGHEEGRTGNCKLWLRDSSMGLHSRFLVRSELIKEQWCLDSLQKQKELLTDIFQFSHGETKQMVFAVLIPLREGGRSVGSSVFFLLPNHCS